MPDQNQPILVKLTKAFGAHEAGALIKTTRAELKAAGLKKKEHWTPRGIYTGNRSKFRSTLHEQPEQQAGEQTDEHPEQQAEEQTDERDDLTDPVIE